MNTIVNIKLSGTLYIIFVLLIVLFLNEFGCTGAIEIQSNSRTIEISTDCENIDWPVVPLYLQDENISFSMINDDIYIYLRITTDDRRRASQIIRQGLTLWFDGEGGKNRSFGLHYPVGFDNNRNPERMMGDPGISSPDNNNLIKKDIMEMMKNSFKEVEIINQDRNEIDWIALDKLIINRGIFVCMKNVEKTLIYEVRIPLKNTGPDIYSIKSSESDFIGVGIQSGKSNSDFIMGMPPPDSEGMGPGGIPPGEMPPGGIGGRDGPKRQTGNEKQQNGKKIDIWFKIKPAK